MRTSWTQKGGVGVFHLEGTSPKKIFSIVQQEGRIVGSNPSHKGGGGGGEKNLPKRYLTREKMEINHPIEQRDLPLPTRGGGEGHTGSRHKGRKRGSSANVRRRESLFEGKGHLQGKGGGPTLPTKKKKKGDGRHQGVGEDTPALPRGKTTLPNVPSGEA